MVQVREAQPEKADGSIDIYGWIARLPIQPDETGIGEIKLACQLASEAGAKPGASEFSWGEKHSAFRTGLEMADILADLQLDHESLLAAIVYRSVREEVLSIESVRQHLGVNVARFVEGVLRMAAITSSQDISSTVLGQSNNQSEATRKMLVALVDDVRVALIKLAERTCAIRALKDNQEKRSKVAKEVFEIYAPLAHRLGIGHIKWELEDLSFRYLEPSAYKRIAALLDERRMDRQQYIEEVVETLESELHNANIEADVSGRAKHIYSIWRKMQRKQIGFAEVYDIRAVRILVPDIKDCYAVLGIVHTLWRNIPKEFDDYIAIPKENGYRSLHTAVLGKKGKVLEIQIRTHDMHAESELGVCAHWLYKDAETAKDAAHDSKDGYEKKIAWLRQILDWHEESGGVEGVAKQLSNDWGDEHVYVFTPDGHVVEMTKGATPLDFAYHIHTEVGHCCRGVKVNGHIVPLTYQLKTGEQVTVITGKESAPSRDWLRPSLCYLNTSRARAKVRQWFREQDRDHSVATGRILLEKEFKRLALTSLDYKEVSKRLHFDTVDDMYAAVGAGDIGPGTVVNAAQDLADPVENYKAEHRKRPKPVAAAAVVDDALITIDGVGNLFTQVAQCCKPLPGEAITGYITVGRGVTIHRQDCAKVLQLEQKDADRIIQVEWGRKHQQPPQQAYPVSILIQAYNRQRLLSDVTTLLANEKKDILDLSTSTDADENSATIKVTIEVESFQNLGMLLAKINRVPNVVTVTRLRDGN